MRFGHIPLAEAEGALLAHTLRIGGITFVKGRRLTPDDLQILDAHGVAEVTAARQEAGDVHQDAAAERIARVLTGPNICMGQPSHGRCDLHAQGRGLLRLDGQRIAAMNGVDEAITLATLPLHEPVVPGDTVASVRVLPFAVPEATVFACLERLTVAPLLDIAEYRPFRASLLVTRVADTSEHDLAAAAALVSGHVASVGGAVAESRSSLHEDAAVEAALRNADIAADIILVDPAVATVDRADVVPAAITRLGGHIYRFGMPVEPIGTLLWGELDGRPVVVLPGSVRGHEFGGFDVILRRFAAGLEISPATISRLGMGGLLRHHQLPEDEELPLAPDEPRVAAVLLAVGGPEGHGKKLLAAVEGEPAIRRAVRAALASSAWPVVVVVADGAESIEEALSGVHGVQIVKSPRPEAGLSEHLRIGLDAVPLQVAGALVLHGDMPFLRGEDLEALLRAFQPDEGPGIWVPTFRGKRGEPLLVDRRLFAEATSVAGDQALASLLDRYGDAVHELATDSPTILMDVDTMEALSAWSATA